MTRTSVAIVLAAGLVLTGAPASRRHVAAQDSTVLRYDQAAYCVAAARHVNDADLERRWSRVRAAYYPLLREDQQLAQSRSARARLEADAASLPAAALGGKVDECRRALPAAETAANAARDTWVRDTVAARDARRAPYINPHAPPKFTALDLAAALATNRDLGAHEALRDKGRAWTAYCWIASQALAAFIRDTPAAFGLQDNPTEMTRVLGLADGQRARLRAALIAAYPTGQEARAQTLVQTLRPGYENGLNAYVGRMREAARFVTVQAFECDDGLELAWGGAP